MRKKCATTTCGFYNDQWEHNCQKLSGDAYGYQCERFTAQDEAADFDLLVNARCEKIKSVLVTKAKEYASEQSRFHNFELAGSVLGCTPEKALEGMMAKHLISVMDIINNPRNRSAELVEEKCLDLINYIILLEGLLAKRRSEEGAAC